MRLQPGTSNSRTTVFMGVSFLMDLLETNSMILALECGAMTKEEAISWADKLIVESEIPDERLFDLSLSKDIYEAISHLRAFGSHGNSSEVAKRAFTLFAKGLEENKTTFEAVTRKLNDMAFSDFVPTKGAESPMMCFGDELEDAKLGIYGDTDTIKNECRAFLHQHGS